MSSRRQGLLMVSTEAQAEALYSSFRAPTKHKSKHREPLKQKQKITAPKRTAPSAAPKKQRKNKSKLKQSRLSGVFRPSQTRPSFSLPSQPFSLHSQPQEEVSLSSPEEEHDKSKENKNPLVYDGLNSSTDEGDLLDGLLSSDCDAQPEEEEEEAALSFEDLSLQEQEQPEIRPSPDLASTSVSSFPSSSSSSSSSKPSSGFHMPAARPSSQPQSQGLGFSSFSQGGYLGFSQNGYGCSQSFQCTPMDQPVTKANLAAQSEQLQLQRANGGGMPSAPAQRRPPAPNNHKKRRRSVHGRSPVTSQSGGDWNSQASVGQAETVQLQVSVPDSINSNPFAPPSSSSSSFLPPSSSSNLRSFDRLSHEFHMIKRVGGGKFGEVYHVQHRLDGSHYAIKQLKQHCQPSNTSRLGEVFALSAVSHPNLLRYYSSWMQRQPDSAKCALHIQTQWLEGGTVASAMVKCKGGKKTASVNRYHVLELGMQMADALHYMHSAAVNMVHLDVKPENIMMTLENEEDELCKPRFVLCDFGGVVRADAHSMGDQGEGDKRYLPEEAIQHRIEDLSKIDMFALGATLFECATHVPLSLHGGWDAKFGDSELLMHNVGEQLGRLIMNLLARDPELRPSAEDVLTQLTAISFADDADDEFGPETESQDF